MKLNQSFSLNKPLQVVWDYFQNIPEVATCMPGAELLEDRGDEGFVGRITIKLGPFRASFDGEAVLTTDEANHSGHLVGKGVDKKGGSRSKMVMDFVMVEENGETNVSLDADIQLSGPIAQFGRTGIINETAAILIGQFVENVEVQLIADTSPTEIGGTDAPTTAAPKPVQSINAGKMFWLLVKSFFTRLFRRD